MRRDFQKAAVKVASALLMQHKELSVEDIKALPFFMSTDEAEAVIGYLRSNFDVEVYHKRISRKPILEWEEMIRLKTA